ncbi:tryptophan-rich protein TspO-like [Bolinopsis microptera]|uniref:tryptophan-rich protein TspO-like n=1 Tax=Bolinopsis microptera TaxID=2820187 RepID=UPI00307ADCB3
MTTAKVPLELGYKLDYEPSAPRISKKDLLMFLAFLLLTEGGGAIIGIASAGQIATWYKDLVKPSWNPPNWLFGPMWTTLYFLQAVSAFMIWKSIGFKKALPWLLFFTQLALNFAWTPIFFIAHQLLWASVESTFQAFFILFTITIFGDINKTAGLLLLPYLAWVTFATYLSFTIWQLNPETLGLWIIFD